ncbi:hypothetical protein ACEPPN_007360 [Leptodophora sp. 'Broadleaf-Isolate-01']
MAAVPMEYASVAAHAPTTAVPATLGLLERIPAQELLMMSNAAASSLVALDLAPTLYAPGTIDARAIHGMEVFSLEGNVAWDLF